MKSIKTIIIAGLLILMMILGYATESNAYPKVRIYAAPRLGFYVSKPGPDYIWIDGHYKYNRYGVLVWVPGQWKRI